MEKVTEIQYYAVSDKYKVGDWTHHLYMRPFGSSEKSQKKEDDYFYHNTADQKYGMMCYIFHNQKRIGYGFSITATESFDEDIIRPRIFNMLKQYIPNCPVLEIRFFDECDL